MKIWIEFPESSRAKKLASDILFTPVYFANEEIKASLKFDDEWQQKYKLSEFPAKIILSGRASLGYLSLGSHPANALDTRYALPTAGFRTVYKLDMLEMPQTIHLEDDQNLYPFSFTLPTSTLTQMQQVASSMRVISADASCTMDALRVMSPALAVSVNYVLSASVQPPGQPKTEMHQEIRIFVGLSGEQVPFMSPDFLAANPLASIVTTQIIPLSRMSKRRASIPLIRRMSRSSSAVQDDPYLVIDAAPPKPFTFRRTDEAAATKVMLTLTYHNNANGADDDDDRPPPPIVASVQWMMKSLTTLTLEPLATVGDPDREDDYFRLRAKILPLRKNKLTWSDWKKTAAPVPSVTASTGGSSHNALQRQMSAASGATEPLTRSTTAMSTLSSGTTNMLTSTPTNQSAFPAPPTTANGGVSAATDLPPSGVPPNDATPRQPPSTPPKRWMSTIPLWLTLPIHPLPSPSFTTSYLTHLYYLSLTLRFNTSSSSSASASSFAAGLSFSGKTSNVELSIPLQIRYELDMAPGYEVDESLPEYEWATGPVDEEDWQQNVQAEGIEQTSNEIFEPTHRTDANGHLDGLPGYADATTPTTETGATMPVSSGLAHDGPSRISAGATSVSANTSSTPAHGSTSSQPQVAPSMQWTMSPPAVPDSEVLSTEDDELIDTLMRRMRPVGLSAMSPAAESRTFNTNDTPSRGAAAGGRRRYGSDD